MGNIKRGKGRFKTDLGIDYLYEFYGDQTFRSYTDAAIRAKVDRKSSFYLTKPQFRKLLFAITLKITNLLIYKGLSWRTPGSLGNLEIIKYKSKVYEDENGELVFPFPPDYVATKKYGKLVYNFNEHSDGYIYKIKLKRKYVNLPFRDLLTFKPCRTFKRRIAQAVKSGEPIDYPTKQKCLTGN